MTASLASPRVRRLVIIAFVAAAFLAVLPNVCGLMLRWYLDLGTGFDAAIPLPPQVTVTFSYRISALLIGIAGLILAGTALVYRRRQRRDARGH